MITSSSSMSLSSCDTFLNKRNHRDKSLLTSSDRRKPTVASLSLLISRARGKSTVASPSLLISSASSSSQDPKGKKKGAAYVPKGFKFEEDFNRWIAQIPDASKHNKILSEYQFLLKQTMDQKNELLLLNFRHAENHLLNACQQAMKQNYIVTRQYKTSLEIAKIMNEIRSGSAEEKWLEQANIAWFTNDASPDLILAYNMIFEIISLSSKEISKEFAEAWSSLKTYYTVDPHNKDALQHAIQIFEKASSRKPTEARTLFFHAYATWLMQYVKYMEQHRDTPTAVLDLILTQIEECRGSGYSNAAVLALQGCALFQRYSSDRSQHANDLNGSIEQLDEAVKLGSQDSIVWAIRGYARWDRYSSAPAKHANDLVVAATSLDQAMVLDKRIPKIVAQYLNVQSPSKQHLIVTDPLFWAMRGHVCWQLYQSEWGVTHLSVAAASLDQAVQLGSKDPKIWAIRGYAHLELYRFDSQRNVTHLSVAAASLDQAVRLGSKDPNVWAIRGYAHLYLYWSDPSRHANDLKAAAEYLDQAVQLGSQEPRIWTIRGYVHLELYKFDTQRNAAHSSLATASLDKAVQWGPKDPVVWAAKGYVYLKLYGSNPSHPVKDLPAAAISLHKAIKLGCKDLDVSKAAEYLDETFQSNSQAAVKLAEEADVYLTRYFSDPLRHVANSDVATKYSEQDRYYELSSTHPYSISSSSSSSASITPFVKADTNSNLSQSIPSTTITAAISRQHHGSISSTPAPLLPPTANTVYNQQWKNHGVALSNSSASLANSSTSRLETIEEEPTRRAYRQPADCKTHPIISKRDTHEFTY